MEKRSTRSAVRPLVLLAVATCALLIILPSCSSGASTTSPLTIRIMLGETRVAAGQPIAGFAVITNHTSKPITVEACAEDGWLDVGLANKTITYDPATSTVACAPTVHLKPGVNGFPIEVLTTFLSCAQGGPTTVNHPPCTAKGPPSLPVGHYSTEVVTFGLPAGTPAPPPVAVTLVTPKR